MNGDFQRKKIIVIENGFPKFIKLPPRSLKVGEGRNRFGFFGQINPYKGLHIVLEGLLRLKKNERKKIRLFINGPNIESLSEEMKALIEKPLKVLQDEGIVYYLGPYKRYEEMMERMRKIDWVILPSIWWENSPMVIQEAFGMGRPVLVSNIGGMAEKVRDGLTGFHVPVGDSLAWGEKMLELASFSNSGLWNNLYNNLSSPPLYTEIVKKHLEILEIK